MNNLLRSHSLLIVLALAAVVRIGALLAFPSVFAFDQTGQVHGSEAYDVYAQNLLATGVYGRIAGEPDAAIPPLYSVALAAIYAVFGRGYLQVGLFHTLLDLGSIALLYLIGKRLLSHWAGILAGVFYAVYPYLVFQNLTLIDTPFFMFQLHLFLYGVILLRDRPRLDARTLALAAGCGAILGVATLTRPVLPFLAVLVALWFLFRLNFWQSVARLLPVALVSALALVPWIVRNQGVYNTFVPMTLTTGANFFQGSHADTIPYLRAGYDLQWIGAEEITADPYSPEGDRQRTALAMQYLREHPDQVLPLFWYKFLAYWSVDVFPRRNPVAGQVPRLDYEGNPIVEADAQGNLQLGGVPEGDPVTVYSSSLFDEVGRTLHRLYFGPLLVLALLGIALTLRQWRDVSLLWFVQISMTLLYVLFHPSTRYRVPTDPLLFLFSAHAMIWLWAWLKVKQGERRLHPAAHS